MSAERGDVPAESARRVDLVVTTGRWSGGLRYFLVLALLGIALAGGIDWLAWIRIGPRGGSPWVLSLDLPASVAMAACFGLKDVITAPVRLLFRSDGLTIEYGSPGDRKVSGPWDEWAPTGFSRVRAVVYFQLGAQRYITVTFPQARAILDPRWRATWTIPEDLRRALTIAPPARPS